MRARGLDTDKRPCSAARPTRVTLPPIACEEIIVVLDVESLNSNKMISHNFYGAHCGLHDEQVPVFLSHTHCAASESGLSESWCRGCGRPAGGGLIFLFQISSNITYLWHQ